MWNLPSFLGDLVPLLAFPWIFASYLLVCKGYLLFFQGLVGISSCFASCLEVAGLECAASAQGFGMGGLAGDGEGGAALPIPIVCIPPDEHDNYPAESWKPALSKAPQLESRIIPPAHSFPTGFAAFSRR